MISYLFGKLVEKSPRSAVIETGGFGLALTVSKTTFEALPAIGATCRLYTYLSFPQQSDQPVLYGFFEEDERELFLTLISISGIGAKGAIRILSGVSPQKFAEVVAAENVDFLTTIPGVGKKSAQRIIVELREKLPALTAQKGLVPGLSAEKSEEVLRALSALGLSGYEARKALEQVAGKSEGKKLSELSTEDLIRRALAMRD